VAKKIFKNTFFLRECHFCEMTFRLSFWENGLKKIQDGIRFEITLRKSIKRKKNTSAKSVFAVLQASGWFEKIEMLEFLNFKNLQFVKNTAF
jgi:hypothetical protein